MKTRPAVKRHRILIVDDDPVCRQFCSHTLSKAGYLPVEASDVHTAIDQVLSLQPDVVFMDMHLPDGSACEMLGKLRMQWPAVYKRVQFIGMSGDDSEATRTDFGKSGCHSVLNKPFSSEILIDAVLTVLNPPMSVNSVTTATFANPAMASRNTASHLHSAFRTELLKSMHRLDRQISTLDWPGATDTLHRLTGGAAFTGHKDLVGRCNRLRRSLYQNGETIDCGRLAIDYLDFLWRAAELLQSGSGKTGRTSDIPDQ